MKKIQSCILFFVLILYSIVAFGNTPVSADQYDTLGLSSGEYYYIKNVQTGKYLDVFNAEDADGTGVWTYQSNRSDAQLWKITRVSGKYRIESACSQSGRSLTTNSSQWTFINTYNASSYQKFYIERWNEANGIKDGVYTIRHNNSYLAVGSGGSYPSWVTSMNSSNAQWTFEKEFMGVAYAYAMNSDIDTRPGCQSYTNNLLAMGYSTRLYVNNSNFNGDDDPYSNAYLHLSYADLFLNSQHGSEAVSGFYKRNTGNPNQNEFVGNWVSDNGYVFVRSNAISTYQNNALAGTRCVIWMSCKTGLNFIDGNIIYNIVDSTYLRGAHFVLAPTFNLYVSDGNTWLSHFMARLNAGDTINTAIAFANGKVPAFKNKLYQRGDGNQFIGMT